MADIMYELYPRMPWCSLLSRARVTKGF